jgi:DinB superfamily
MSSNAIAAAVTPPPVSQDPEVEQARAYFTQTRDGLIGATKGLSPAQWNFKAAPDRWSIAENLEHVVFVQERVLGPMWEQLAVAPAAPAHYDRAEIDLIVLHWFPDRRSKIPGPEALHPTGRWSPAEALDRLRVNYARMNDLVESVSDLRQHAIQAVPLKLFSEGKYEVMDGYQWLLAAAAHTERHTKQMLEVKADPNFPA